MTTKTMTVYELSRSADDFLRKNFNMRLEIPIKINGRLLNSMGRYQAMITKYPDGRRTLRPKSIEIAKRMIEYASDEEILDTLYHECVHYALSVQNKPYKDGDAYFENKLRELGVSATETSPFVGRLHVYVCACEQAITRKRKDGHNYICCDCNQKLRYVGEKIVNSKK